MKARVALRRAAELDLAAIQDWYEAQQAGLGAEFREAVDELVGHIGDNPLSYPERYRGNRRAILRGSPTSSGTDYTETLPSSWPVFTVDVIRGWPELVFARAFNPLLPRPHVRHWSAEAAQSPERLWRVGALAKVEGYGGKPASPVELWKVWSRICSEDASCNLSAGAGP